MFERQPRLPTEPALRAAHFLADHDPQITGLRVQTDRQRWLGRNQAVCRPLADLDDAPAVSEGQHAVPLHTGLDPVCALAVRLRIAPGGQAQLTFATATITTFTGFAGAAVAWILKFLAPFVGLAAVGGGAAVAFGAACVWMADYLWIVVCAGIAACVACCVYYWPRIRSWIPARKEPRK